MSGECRSVDLETIVKPRDASGVAPALHDADKRTLDDLTAAFTDLVKRARVGSLKSSEVIDPVITITSLGERGVESIFGIIYPPQLALAGFGKPVERPWVVEGQVCARRVITATLSGDHRATDGHRGAQAGAQALLRRASRV